MNPENKSPALKPVLYAEDEPDDVFFMEKAFREAEISHRLIIVQDGAQTINYLLGVGAYSNRQEFPLPCLLLLDLNLPKLSGLEVLKRIRNETSVSTLPVIVLTSSLQEADIHRAYLQGANAYLVKPSAPRELTQMARSIRDFWLKQNRFAETPRDILKEE